MRQELAGGDTARLMHFLKGGLGARPWRIEWHRAYQNLFPEADNARLIKEYDAMLAAAPGDSTLLYLRGRLCLNAAEGQGYFKRALAADGENAYAAFALAFDAAAAADWAGAKGLLDRPVQSTWITRNFWNCGRRLAWDSGKSATATNSLAATIAAEPAGF